VDTVTITTVPVPGAAAAHAVQAVLEALPDVRGWQEDFYRDVHAHPELSHREYKTAKKVAGRLDSFGYHVHEGIGGTGVVGILRNGDGPVVLLRAEMDALPVLEATGLPYSSTVTDTDSHGNEVPVAHVCGHDMHTTCLLGAAQLLADSREHWNGTLVALFQPAEEVGDGARRMIDDNLAAIIPRPDVALAQHNYQLPAGLVGTRPGPALAIADNMRITVHGRGGPGSMPHTTIDPVALAAMIVVRLHTVVSREVPPSETAVLTVGSIRAGNKSNVIPDRAVLELNIRSYSDHTRKTLLDAIYRIVAAECQASACPRDPEFILFDQFPLTDNDEATTSRVADAFTSFFGDRAQSINQVPASEDFSDIPNAFGTPYTYWGIGCIDPDTYRKAADAGRIAQDIPAPHAPNFAPVIQPTCDTGTQALVVAALAWLGGRDQQNRGVD